MINQFHLSPNLKFVADKLLSQCYALAQIKLLRRAGHLICSAAGENGGYYLISSLDEFNEFMQTEFLSKIRDMSKTAHVMTHAATKKFGGHVNQLSLF